MSSVISLELIKENKDGSADYLLNMSDADKESLVRWAVLEILKKFIEEGKNLDPSQNNLENT